MESASHAVAVACQSCGGEEGLAVWVEHRSSEDSGRGRLSGTSLKRASVSCSSSW